MGKKAPAPAINRRLVTELERLVGESQRATEQYMAALEEGRKSAEEVVRLLMEKNAKAESSWKDQQVFI